MLAFGKTVGFLAFMAIDTKKFTHDTFSCSIIKTGFRFHPFSGITEKIASLKMRYIFKAVIASLLVSTSIAPCTALHAQTAENQTDKPDLTVYLRRLAAQPHDINALIGAGLASYRAGDMHAALGFLTRAENMAPHDGKVKAALGSIFIQQEKPQQALKYFHEAISNGIPPATVASDTGLAYDLMGNNGKATSAYEMALTSHPDDETERRFALSQAIAGHTNNALTLIDRQLRQQNRAAWRTRALILALNGDVTGATGIIRSTMPAGSAEAMLPFLNRLPSLSLQEKAAAVHFGDMKTKDGKSSQPLWTGNDSEGPDTQEAVSDLNFDTMSNEKSYRPAEVQNPSTEVGEDPISPLTVKDDDELNTPKAISKNVRKLPSKSGDNFSTIGKAPLSSTIEKSSLPKTQKEDKDTLSVKTAENVAIKDKNNKVRTEAEMRAYCKTTLEVPKNSKGKKTRQATAQSLKILNKQQMLKIDQCLATQKRNASKANKIDNKVVSEKSIPETKTLSSKLVTDSKIKGLSKPDLQEKIAADRIAAEKSNEKNSPTNTSIRYWVQVASGENKANLLAVWQKLLTRYPLLKTTQPWTTPWHASNRLLAGPFSSEEKAQDFVNKLRKSGFSTIQFTSRKGIVVERLAAK